jgi:hypothetical protein
MLKELKEFAGEFTRRDTAKIISNLFGALLIVLWLALVIVYCSL